MTYIINGIIEYDAVNGTLLSPEYHLDMITLSRVSSELLFIFVTNNQQPVSRERLLYDLWESKGLNASSNSLNNYISMLRKALLQCGCNDLITTIPKYGFVFDAEIKESNAPPEYANLRQESSNTVSGTCDSGQNNLVVKQGVSSWRNIVRILILTMVVLAILVGLIRLYYDYRLGTIRSEIFQQGQCRFYAGNDRTRNQPKDEAATAIKNMVAFEKIRCPGVRTNVYYFSDIKQDASGHTLKEELLSYCPYNSKSPCVNYYFTTQATHDEEQK
ncbi:helix-turn-helix domain-containing protein [Enterobacter asburiae]|uniref:winged helix-turn-helix domain-containing protein n=1 Tax=Scandinavium sp. UTDF21-P1B TaxID=3446379 RepID=UPI00348A7E68